MDWARPQQDCAKSRVLSAPCCTKHAFIFPHFECFDIWGPSQLLWVVNDLSLACVEPFIGKPTNPEPQLPTPSSSSSYTLTCRPLPRVLTTQGRYHTTHDCPYSSEPLKLSKPANPESAYPASPIPSHGNRNKGSHICFPLSVT